MAALQLVRDECSRAAFPMALRFSSESSNSAIIAIASFFRVEEETADAMLDHVGNAAGVYRNYGQP